ncbi:MAG TPA: glycosyltransferase family 4 protein [Aliidongia sp.]|uniref:glycosyltransferase family 4 protein n=1 Tax=Aliidongia sp. TaxID=1914230 RepID=UPI002DDD73E6|nr:glycosyltransferase family 4 protein [Aliidongia sp.]HEV2673836.1 glycosyltransferase family 4 protein [Aliidongia sp.]
MLLWQWQRRGAGPKYTLDLARALLARGRVELALSISRQAEIVEQLRALDLPTQEIDTYRSGIGFLAATTRLSSIRNDFRDYLRRQRIETVVATMSHLWNPLMVGLIAPTGARLVTVVHDAASHPGDAYPLRQRLVGRELRASDRVVTLTDHVGAGVRRIFGYPPERIAVIPHGAFRFDTAPIPVREWPEGRPFRFLFFGRLRPYKGLDLLMAAIDRIDPKVNFELMIVGAGDLGPLARRIADHPRVRLDQRWIPEDAVGGIFAAADATVAPYREASQSGVLAASYGAGLPMIATPVGGLAEQILPFDAGLVSPDLTPDGFAAAMTRLATEPALYRRLAAHAVAAAEGPLSWDRIAQQFEDVIAAA